MFLNFIKYKPPNLLAFLLVKKNTFSKPLNIVSIIERKNVGTFLLIEKENRVCALCNFKTHYWLKILEKFCSFVKMYIFHSRNFWKTIRKTNEGKKQRINYQVSQKNNINILEYKAYTRTNYTI